MSPNPTATQTSPIVRDFFDRGLRAQSAVDRFTAEATSIADGAAPVDASNAPADESAEPRINFREFDACISAAALAIANADRALRCQPAVTHVNHLHPAMYAVCQDAAIRAVLEQHPAARVEAFGDTGDELQRFVEKLLEDPDKRAICHDPDLMRDACLAMVRVMSSTYRKSLHGQMSVFRSADVANS